MNEIAHTLDLYGGDPTSILMLDEDGPELLPYATLVASRARAGSGLQAVVGVYEWQGEPLMFLVDAGSLGTDGKALNRIRRILAMRGDAPYLGVVALGRLDVYRVALDQATISKAHLAGAVQSGSERATLPRLGNSRMGTARRKWIAQVVLGLLDRALGDLTGRHRVGRDDAISLVGRALFTRFLSDRDLISACPAAAEGAHSLFDDADRAAATSKWLDDIFNGDFLPLSDGLFRSLPAPAFKTLGDILRGARDGQLELGWQDRWDFLDFAHIPVGVLSQAYERYLGKHHREQQQREGGYYTPRPVADIMVHAAFEALAREGDAARARALDPAAGAGMFLITVFRRLVAERWRRDGKRPGTDVLRDILYSQIKGFDINEAALRFAALGLYLMSIELDPEPEPVEKLRFGKNMRGTVLHMLGAPGGGDDRTLGSLGSAVGDEHNGAYDLVIGNPPWSSGTKLPQWPEAAGIVAAIAGERRPGAPVPSLPNENLDLPFVWRAMQWARDGGQIALALHARLLFQQGDRMPVAREAVFACLDVTGIVNGAELRTTKVWPEVDAPFCLLFATNRIPPPGAGFRFVTPRLEEALNDAGIMRIDAGNAELIASEEVRKRPELLKILFRGTHEDLRLYERMTSAERELTSVAALWSSLFPNADRRLRRTGNGYQKHRPSSRPRVGGNALGGASAAYLKDMPHLTAGAEVGLEIDATELPRFESELIHDERALSIFLGPLLIVRKSPPAGYGRIPVHVCDRNVVYSETYYGYSAKGHAEAERLVRYAALVVGSKPAFWLSLITSGEFGFEREVVEKSTIDGLLLPAFSALGSADLDRMDRLFRRVARVGAGDEAAWSEVDAWVAELYGLDARDLRVIADTLEFGLPFSENRVRAQSVPTAAMVNGFCRVLGEELLPWAEDAGRTLSVVPGAVDGSPWRSVVIRQGQTTQPTSPAGYGDWSKLIGAADRLAATEMMYQDVTGPSLWVARLAQARYWSATQARLVAQHVVWNHIGWLVGGAG